MIKKTKCPKCGGTGVLEKDGGITRYWCPRCYPDAYTIKIVNDPKPDGEQGGKA